MTLRLSDDMAAGLATIARIEGMTVSDVVREAIDNHIEARRADPEFQRRVQELIENDLRVLERLLPP